MVPYSGVFPSHLSMNCCCKICGVMPLEIIRFSWVFNSASSLRFLCSMMLINNAHIRIHFVTAIDLGFHLITEIQIG